MIKVSIIIPTHNRAEWLPDAIDSAKGAGGSDTEIIVVDDASQDNTQEICRATTGIRYLRFDQNVGLARARNAGIELSKGCYLVFLDDDDRRLPDSLNAQIELLDREPNLSFVYGPVLLANSLDCVPTGRIAPEECVTGDIFWRLLETNFIRVPSVLARKKLVEEAGGFDLTVRGVEDWLMWIRLAERLDVGAVDRPVAIYREPTRKSHQMSSNAASMAKFAARAQAIGLRLPKALNEPEARQRVRLQYLDGLSWQLVEDGLEYLAEGDYFAALKSYFEAVRLHPTRALRPYNLKLLLSKLRTSRV
jgi:glycosyltransferase involved in cell wall biosynthesis